ncbi:MAG: shikimate kinase [Gammaproteobacteria bacterium]|nr:MAG: shikimate kinase [Gammaproteobacteria bacterium]PIE36985.1 MAG: shikimate kinase [Gammaproteobacteria bacterium]
MATCSSKCIRIRRSFARDSKPLLSSIFLVGPMGAGKSSVGRALARRLGYGFHDSDREIEERCGVDIPTIFEYEGETGFREREERIIDELTNLPDVVLATGGGAVLREANRERLRRRGHVILLKVDPDEQFRRVSGDTSRPLLQTANPKQRLAELMREREPIYRAVADVEIATDSRRMHHVVTRILNHLKRHDLIASTNKS